jgi:type IV pilus assembly protein PilA
MNCPYCAELIADDSQFCPKCGSRLGVSYPAAPGSVSPPFGTGGQKTSGKAIASLICGVFTWFLPASIAAIVLGHLSLSEIRKSAGRLKGHGMAVAGLVLGYVGVALIPFILIIAAIAIPNLLRARMAANEASSVGSLRTYSMAIETYASQCPDRGFPASTTQLGPGGGDCDHANIIDGQLGSASPIRSGYVFSYVAGPADESGRIKSYTISADPVTQNTTGIRHFFMDETGIIRCEQSGPASAASPPLR